MIVLTPSFTNDNALGAEVFVARIGFIVATLLDVEPGNIERVFFAILDSIVSIT